MSNPRKNSYGYTLRIQCDTPLSQFRDITIYCSASSNGGFALNLSVTAPFTLGTRV
jgi:hypothetical protein